MNTSLFLKYANLKNSAIIIYATYDGKRIRISSGISIETKYWDPEKQRVKKNHPRSLVINAWLEKLTSEFHRAYIEAKTLNIEPSIQYLKGKVEDMRDSELKRKEIKVEKDFFDHYDEFMNFSKMMKQNAVIKSYKTSKNHLLDFEKQYKTRISFDSINQDFYDKYVYYLATVKNSTNNTIGKRIKELKVFLRWALDHDLTNNIKFLKFKVIEEETNYFALSDDEVDRIENLNLESNERLSRVRDLFLILVNTSLRYSDLKNLKPENVNLKEKYIKIREIKTKGEQIIAIIPPLQKILNKYPDLKFPIVTNQEINRCVKEIGKLAEIDAPFQIVRYKGKERVEITKPKYELITCHTGRRTNITRNLRRGTPSHVLRKQTGHKSNKHFDIYEKLVEKDVVDVISKYWEE